MTWEDAVRTIGREEFDRHKRLYIEYRTTPALKPEDALLFLVKKNIIRPRLQFWPRLLHRRKDVRCGHCGPRSRVRLTAFEKVWHCPYCGHGEDLAIRIGAEFRAPRCEWRFQKSGLFAKDNNQEGALPVILTLLQLLRLIDRDRFMWLTAMKLRADGVECETDLVVFSHGHRDEIELGVGECKDEGGTINERDVLNLERVRERFKGTGIECFLIFAKAADSFSPEEIALFRGLNERHVPVVLLTNHELEPYEPYDEYREGAVRLPVPYAFSLADMARNSASIYLAESPDGGWVRK